MTSREDTMSEHSPTPHTISIAHSGNDRQDVSIGDTFDWWDGTSWKVEGFTGIRIYSPSGLGGTPILRCRQTAGKPLTQYLEEDGTVEWCGDSVASVLSRAKQEERP